MQHYSWRSSFGEASKCSWCGHRKAQGFRLYRKAFAFYSCFLFHRLFVYSWGIPKVHLNIWSGYTLLETRKDKYWFIVSRADTDSWSPQTCKMRSQLGYGHARCMAPLHSEEELDHIIQSKQILRSWKKCAELCQYCGCSSWWCASTIWGNMCLCSKINCTIKINFYNLPLKFVWGWLQKKESGCKGSCWRGLEEVLCWLLHIKTSSSF